MASDLTGPPFSDAPSDLSPALLNARLQAVENDRQARTIILRFDLPADAGTTEATFTVHEATHLLEFVYLPPSRPLGAATAEETMAAVGDWARQGLIATADPFTFGTPLTVQKAFLHAVGGTATLTVEGYGEDAERLVWWEVRVSGARIDAG